MHQVTTFVFVSMGAGFYWALAGFAGTFNSFMSKPGDFDAKYWKNLSTGIALTLLLVTILYRILR